MTIGADRKKLIWLGGLLLVGIYFLWTNVFSSSDSSTPHPRAAAVPTVVAPTPTDTARVLSRRAVQHGGSNFDPVFKGKPVDPLTVDPTLRLDLLAKVQNENADTGAQRNIFTFGETSKPADMTLLPKVPQIPFGKNGKPAGPLVTGPVTPPAPPGPPPITLKYYGFSSPKFTGHKRAFFLDGEDIIVASEGDMVKRRYKLVKIGVNSVTVEDTQFNNNQQTLPLAADIPS